MMAYYKKHGSMKGLSKRIPQHELRRAMEEEMGVEEESPEETIERLEKDVATLASKCARLEAQNILVAVQQLDVLAKVAANLLSIVSLYLYLRLVFWTVGRLPAVIETQFDQTFHWAIWWAIKLSLSTYPYLYNKMTFGVTHRRFEVFCVAFIVIARTRLARWRERTFAADNECGGVTPYGEECPEEAIWDANYEISARFLYVSILRLKGLWTKTAQYLSSRADFVPASYVRELRRLQDEAPATDWKDIKLPRRIAKQLTGIDPNPLASASIGQVHVARVKATGEKVVIKVQHPSARTLMTDDFWSLKVISRIVAWMDPEFEFFEILMKEWAKEAHKELDFMSEADNLIDAQKSIDLLFTKKNDVMYTNKTGTISEAVPFQVEIPRPLLELTNRDFLVMSFCEGQRVDDFEIMEQQGIQRDAVMDAVAQTFSHMMYVSDIFNGDPHPGNLFLRPGTTRDKQQGFTLVLLDWGLAKRLTTEKRVAFCKMAYAAATMDFGLLLDASKDVGLKMKRENVAEDMEGMRFFLRDIVPSQQARKRIKAKMKTDRSRMDSKKKGEKIPMESKAYPGEFFFFVRVNELLHGLGSRFAIEMAYLDVLKPYAERGLQLAIQKAPTVPPAHVAVKDASLGKKLQKVIQDLRDEGKVEGVQVCIIDKDGDYLADVKSGTLGGLKKHMPVQNNSLIVGYSCTKAVASTMAHIMVKEGYLEYDEPVSRRVWTKFCPTEKPPQGLGVALELSDGEVQQGWSWKRSITLRHILKHQAGLWASLPKRMTIQSMSSCETSFAAYEYNPDEADATLLPTRKPGEVSEYHFMSFGWLVAGTLCGAYEKKHGKAATFEDVYNKVLAPKLSTETKTLGFRPCGGSGGLPVANVVTSDIRASRMIQQRRESEAMGEEADSALLPDSAKVFESYRGKEFLLDPRIWNCDTALTANVPAAGGRFSALGLAHFYHDVGTRIFNDATLKAVSEPTEAIVDSGLQGATNMTGASEEHRVSFGLGYQLIEFDKDTGGKPSGVGHAGVGGSIGLFHRDSGLSIALMTNKADGGSDVTTKISRVIMNHFDL